VFFFFFFKKMLFISLPVGQRLLANYNENGLVTNE